MAMTAKELGRRLAILTNEAMVDADAVQMAGLAVSLLGAGLHLCDELGIEREYALQLALRGLGGGDQ